jgi:hypothetical protein
MVDMASFLRYLTGDDFLEAGVARDAKDGRDLESDAGAHERGTAGEDVASRAEEKEVGEERRANES